MLKVPEENIFTHNANAIAETQLRKDATAFNELMELLKSTIQKQPEPKNPNVDDGAFVMESSESGRVFRSFTLYGSNS